MIKNEIDQSQISSLISNLSKICIKLNNCIPQSQQVEVNSSFPSIAEGLDKISQKIIQYFKAYEKIIQSLEDNLRKHIKNQIELKLYYEHLEEVIVGLRKQKQLSNEAINNLKTQLTVLKEKEKYFMTVSNNNTKNYEDHFQSKLDTITKIKNRLSLNGTEQFYNSYIAKKIDKDQQTKQLRDKRQSLANTLKQLYESPIRESKFSRQKNKSKSKQKQQQSSKEKERHKNKGKKTQINKQKLNRSSKSRKSLDKILPKKRVTNIQINHKHYQVRQKQTNRQKQCSASLRLHSRKKSKQKIETKDQLLSIRQKSSRKNSKC